MLIEHREMEQRLRQEILEKVGSERSPTSEDIRELKYLRAFLNGVSKCWLRPKADPHPCCQRSCVFMPYCKAQTPGIILEYLTQPRNSGLSILGMVYTHLPLSSH